MGFGLHPEQEIVIRDTNRLDTDNVVLGNDQDVGLCRGFDVVKGNKILVLNRSIWDTCVSAQKCFVSPAQPQR
jgi:hypothetical protein